MQKAICPHCHKEIDIDSGQLSSGDPNCPLCAVRKDGSDLMIKDDTDGSSYIPMRMLPESLTKETDPDPPILHQLSDLMLTCEPQVKWHSLDNAHNTGILVFGGFRTHLSDISRNFAIFAGYFFVPFLVFIPLTNAFIEIKPVSWTLVFPPLIPILITTLFFYFRSIKDYIFVTRDKLQFKRGHNPKTADLLLEIPRINMIPVKLEVYNGPQNTYSNNANSCYSIFVTNPDTLQTVDVVSKYVHTSTPINDNDAGKPLKNMIRTLLYADLH